MDSPASGHPGLHGPLPVHETARLLQKQETSLAIGSFHGEFRERFWGGWGFSFEVFQDFHVLVFSFWLTNSLNEGYQ